jgi:hypothetical protein
MYIQLLVEGEIDEVIGQAVAYHAGATVVKTFRENGFGYVKTMLPGLNLASKGMPVLALVDLMDTGFGCPVAARDAWLPEPEPQMLFRLVVREIESWLMADRVGIAQFLGVKKDQVPRQPEREPDPKRSLVQLAKKSPYGRIRRGIVPEDRSTAAEGPRYNTELGRFVREQWDIERAMQHAESLARCVRAVERLAETLST